MKKIFFMSGLARAGNTLLSSILNQNPNIYATGKSANVEIMHRIFDIKETDLHKEYPQDFGVDNILNTYFTNFYSDIDKDYIIERGEWITPYNLNILRQYCPNEIKIIVMVRNIEDVIKSFLGVCERNPNYYINEQYELNKNNLMYKDEIDFKVDMIMSNQHNVNMLSSIQNLEPSKEIMFVDYDNFISNVDETINNIYTFLNIDTYIHNFSNIKQLQGYNDEYFYNDTHTIQTNKIKKRDLKIELPDYIIEKYSKYNT